MFFVLPENGKNFLLHGWTNGRTNVKLIYNVGCGSTAIYCGLWIIWWPEWSRSRTMCSLTGLHYSSSGLEVVSTTVSHRLGSCNPYRLQLHQGWRASSLTLILVGQIVRLKISFRSSRRHRRLRGSAAPPVGRGPPRRRRAVFVAPAHL